MIRVRAIAAGYYGHRRRKAGEVFEIEEDKILIKNGEKVKFSSFSSKWMVKVDAKAKTETPEVDNERKPAAMSDGASAALHTGSVNTAAGMQSQPPATEESSQPENNEPNSDEDVI